jgi:hypothetical protein
MFTMDNEARDFFKGKLKDNQVLRVFFGGYG